MKTINNPIDNWLLSIYDKTDQNSKKITPLFDLSMHIKEIFEHKNCPLSGLEVTINQHSILFKSDILGELSDSPTIINDPLGGIPEAECIIKYKLKDKNTASTKWYSKFLEFLTLNWLPDYRKHGGLDLKNSSLAMLLPLALEELSLNSSCGIYCIFADLDKFKPINDQLGHAEGDKAIRDVLGCFETIAQEERIICTIDGGDEYVIFIENRGDTNLLDTLNKISELISSKKYGEGDEKLSLGITFGVHKLDSWGDVDSIKKCISLAEEATKKKCINGELQKKRGTVSFYIQSTIENKNGSTLDDKTFIQLAISLIRSRQNYKEPFSNTILNFISSVAFNYEQNTGHFSDYIENYIKWLNISFVSNLNETEIIGEKHRNPEISNISFALAIAHGVLKRSSSLNLTLRIDQENELLELIDFESGKNLWGKCIEEASTKKDYSIGCFIKSEIRENALSIGVILLLGSFQDLISPHGEVIPRNLFSEIIVVDGRPVGGGGLPDFWQAAMAQLIKVVSECDIKRVIVYGDENGAPNITKLLKNESPYNIDKIVELSASIRSDAEKCMELIKRNGSVTFCKSLQDVIENIYLSLLEIQSDAPTYLSNKNATGVFQRKLDFPESILPLIDGMKCDTAAIAYPVVIEQLRSNDDDKINTYDNAEQPLKEIIGFKLVLHTPSKDSIPEYWTKSNGTTLDEYAQNTLISKTGLIGKRLYENGQFDIFFKSSRHLL